MMRLVTAIVYSSHLGKLEKSLEILD